MSGPFKVGEVLVGHSLTRSAHLNGVECTVEGPMKFGRGWSLETGEIIPDHWAYPVRWANGLCMHVPPHNLRRKRPPSGEQSVYDWFTAPAPREVEAA